MADEVQMSYSDEYKRLMIPIAAGQKFGYWTVLGNDPVSGDCWRWECRCICGNIRVVTSVQLGRGKSRSCGCRMIRFDLEGKKFGKWTVGEYVQKPRGQISKYKCTCECGTVKYVQSRDLRSGGSTNCGCVNKLPEGQAALNCVLTTYKNTATARDLLWDLSNEKFFEMSKMDCYYCGRKPFQVRSYKTVKSVTYMGIDRIDSDLGYILENVVPCCKMCNYAKSCWTQSEFYDWIERVFRHRIEGRDKHESGIS